MKKAWVNKKNKEKETKAQEIRETIRYHLSLVPATYTPDSDFIPAYNEEEISILMNHIDELLLRKEHILYYLPYKGELGKRFIEDVKLWDATKALLEIDYEKLYNTVYHNYDEYLDSEPKHFTGDIIITDPCYIIKDDDWHTACRNIDKPDYELLPGAIHRDTLYGDWSCTVFNTKTKESLGDFCADAGLVIVTTLDEVLKYNPEFNYHIERPWTTTLIKDFDGEIWFEVKHHTGEYEDFSVHVVGKGINTKTGKPISFKSTQTDL